MIDCVYDRAYLFYDGIAECYLNGKEKNIDKNGKEVYPLPEYEGISIPLLGLIKYFKGEKHGFKSADGKIVTQCEYDDSFEFVDRLAGVKKIINGVSLI